MAKEPHYKLTLGFELYPLQQEIYDHVTGARTGLNGELYRFFVLCFGRQSGKSFFCKKLIVDRAINYKEKTMWIAPSIPTAQGHWDDIVAIISRAVDGGFKIKSINQSRKQIKFFGGGEITIRSAIQPDRLRGPSLNLIICDEAAFFPDGQKTFDKIIQPMVTATGGKIVLASTPNGRNWFYDLYTEGLKEVSKFYRSWTSTSLDSPYQDKNLLDDIKRRIPSKQWREEYLAEFLADAGGVFAGVEEAATADWIDRPLPGHSYVAAFDIGFVNDETVFTVIDEFTREQVYGEAWSNVGTLGTLRRMAVLLDLWQPRVTMFEKNGLGETFFDLIKAVFSGRDPDSHLLEMVFVDPEKRRDEDNDLPFSDYDEPSVYGRGVDKVKEVTAGGHILRGVHMDNAMKRAFVDGLSADIEYRRLKILKDTTEYGRKQISQMSTYERKPTNSGMSVTYNAQEGAHDDCVSALYLARKALPRMAQVKLVKDDFRVKTNPFRGGKPTGRRWNTRGN